MKASSFQIFIQTKHIVLAGCPADQSASVRKRQQWDNHSVISVANVAGLYSTPFPVSTPFFFFYNHQTEAR